MVSNSGQSADVPEGILLGCGNPLLDIQLQVEKELLTKYGLNENGAILAEDKHLPLFDEIVKRENVEYIPGGATQNAMRVFQWIVGKPKRAAFFGAVGEDNYSRILREQSESAGVNVRYQVNPKVKTGTCAALIYHHHRSLVADLAAANTFTVDHLNIPENQAIIENAKFYYISGFFLTVCPPAILQIGNHAASEGKYFVMNLAAPFISEFFSKPLNEALPYVDILVANEEEARAYSKANNLGTTNLREIGLKLANIEKVNKTRPRMVIVTQGPDPIIVVTKGETQEFTVPPVSNIEDTNGAGDAFCGGFLAELVRGSSLEKCITCASHAAAVIIQHQGCTFPEKCDYQY